MKSYSVFLDSAHQRCTLNTISSSMIYRYLLENSHTITQNVQTADYIIINSCGYHQDLRDASVALYQKHYAMKKSSAKIIMYGCLVKIDETRLQQLDLLPVSFTDGSLLDKYFFNSKKFEEMTPCCDSTTRNALVQTQGYLDVSHQPNFFLTRFFLSFSKKIKTNYNRMIFGLDHCNKLLVQISQGCLGNCSYCVIKKAKGNLHSRSIDAIITDIERMYDPSKTLYLVADDCSCYGLDSGTNLFMLLKKIREKFPNLSIQMNYISPNFLVKFHNEYRELFQEHSIHTIAIPLQSGSNKIIKNMNRHYDSRQIVKIIEELKQISPQTYFEGHFIVGYPGETIVDYLKSLFATRYFDYPIALVYSDAKGTKSATLSQKKSKITKQIRYLFMIFFINFIVLYKLAANPYREKTIDLLETE